MSRIAAVAGLLFLSVMPHARAVTPESRRLTERGIDQAANGDYRAATASYSKAIVADPTNAQAWHERGMARLELGQDQQAIGDFEQALKLDPAFPGAREWLAKALAGRGDHPRAAEACLAHLRADPLGKSYMGVSPWDWAECAEQFALAGDRARAIQLLEEYFAEYAPQVTYRRSDETAPMRTLARLYDEAGAPEKAAEMRRRARASPHKVPADDQDSK
ncbi:MAG TPA: tetratricopeptide repeat protein [Steroidobacteraceae bacterium]|nr:tetratricopeptide repeat protein [Steroidobacteraceae bacterium]